jgi:hypothetical protein
MPKNEASEKPLKHQTQLLHRHKNTKKPVWFTARKRPRAFKSQTEDIEKGTEAKSSLTFELFLRFRQNFYAP